MIRRRRLKLQWFLTIFITILLSGPVAYKNIKFTNNYNKKIMSVDNFLEKSSLSVTITNNYNNNITHSSTTASILPIRKHVTKSMAQLGKMDEVNKHFLFLNSVPDSGSEILIFLLEKIQGVNDFKHVRLKGGNRRKLNKMQQASMVDKIYEIRRNLPIPLSFDRNLYFLNFTFFDKQLPTYINLIRHPVTKVMARAISKKTGTYDKYFLKCLLDIKGNCKFRNGRPYDLTIPYFCGHDPKCMLLNNNWALGIAKENVEKYYQVVGVLEELNKTLDVLAAHIPQFFSDAKTVYQENLLDIYRHKKELEIPKEIYNALEESLVNEIDFYNFVKERLLKYAPERQVKTLFKKKLYY
ncbi:unnamed protein product [Ceutorhynchus assimilis]|uniref:Uronyl 2-sulfotransferase n=1 Tax=Ceutorhynchus assimilis TaxID=467358 RepID=A0A9N9Q9H6_9CUCU|nr:unnamed protein product [Ceutorhynchus assimilis]